MKFNKQLAIILVLLSMLLSAIAVSIYFYNQNKEVIKSKKQLVTIFVAKNNIKKHTLITKAHIKQTTIARQFVLTRPLLKKEILNKYAKEPIYKNEAFLKEKLSTKIEVKKSKTIEFKYNSYNMAYKMFKNPNYMIQPNDVIKIVSVTNDKGVSVQYVIKNIRVLGFVSDGMASEKSIFKKKVKKVVKKKVIEQIVTVRAAELILDIQEKDMLALIEDWNKGSQLWMVKSKLEDIKNKDKTKKDEMEKIVKKEASINKKKTTKKYYPRKRTYPVKWYYPKKSSITKTATIIYDDKPSLKKTKSVNIANTFNKECSKTDKLLILKSNTVYLRVHPSIRSKIHKKLYKNYVISYSNISKINTSWYLLCDGSYIQSKDVNIISYKEYQNLRNKR